MKNILVSIITPAFNCEKMVLETYNSIKKQTYKNWEWVITEDCSNDHTFDMLQKLALQDQRIKLFRNVSNSGAAVSRNNSIRNANGDYLAFIDSDDLWSIHKLETQLKYMLDNKVDFTFTQYNIIDENGEPKGKVVDSHISKPICYSDMLRKKATLGCSTVMLRNGCISDLSMPLIRTGQDYALWLKILKTGIFAYPIMQVLTSYRITPNSISRNKFKKAFRQWEIYRRIESLSFFCSCYCFAFYAYRAVFRK